MTRKNKNQNRNNFRGASQSQNGASRQPNTEYQEAFQSYERPSNTGRNGDTSYHQGDRSSSSDGSRHREEQRHGNPPIGQGRGEHYTPDNHGNRQHGGGRGYKANDYQRHVNEEAQHEKVKEDSHLQQGSRSHWQQDDRQHRDDGQHQHAKNNSNQMQSLQSGKNKKLNTLKCVFCSDYYNLETRLPRSLFCGHTVCTACLRLLVKRDPRCPHCEKPIKNLKDAEEAKVNFVVRDLVQVRLSAQSDVKTEGKGAESVSCRPKSESSKPIVTATSSIPSGSKSSYNKGEEMEWSPSPEKSPHNSRCLEVGITPTSHCATCLKWVCSKCGNIDHSQQKGCFLIPKKEALSQMTQAQVDVAKGTCETVENTVTELETYNERLGAFSLTMQAAFEAIQMEKKRVEALMVEGQKEKKELDASVAALTNSTNLPDALAALREVEGRCGLTSVWTTASASKTLDHGRVNDITKKILLSTVQMKMMAEVEAKAAVPVVAQHSFGGECLSSCLEVDGGRINVHALKKISTLPVGSRALPLTNVISCLDPSSALTFLDIGWGGSVQGRVFIRLLGDTLRGRQFVMLCTGKAGPSFRQTKFHRVWWKGLPGEHIWGGDHDKGDGSGGASVVKVSDKEKSSLVHGRCLPIRAGLVAGRYEKTGISSIFRIYTKDCKKGRDESTYLAKSPAEVKDEAAFGQVEYGQHILDSVIKLNNIQDVTISNCGIVIET